MPLSIQNSIGELIEREGRIDQRPFVLDQVLGPREGCAILCAANVQLPTE
jgi:hypothetical protein